MKKMTFTRLVMLLMAFFIVSNISAQEKKDAKKEKEKSSKETIKKGWNLGALPVISYDSDLGFQYGALMNLYNYGNGKDYPNYRQSLYMEVSRFTKKSGIYRINYDTKDLIKGKRVYIDLSYMPDQAYSFYGFNGYDAVYNENWITPGNSQYKTKMFYKYQRKFFRFKIDLQGKIKAVNHLFWDVGAGVYNIKTGPVDLAILNKGKSGNDLLPNVPGLYSKYLDWGIIRQNEKAGGTFTVFKAALEYDSRDNEANPNKGIWTEIVLAAAPKFTSTMSDGFYKLSITHRQYFSIVKNKFFFDYRLGAQFNIGGYTPFYALPMIFFAHSTKAYNEGLGGSGNLRGVLRNRVIGNGIMYGNFEFRWKVLPFHFINQNFYIGLVTFFDSGMVIQKYKFNEPTNASVYSPNTKSDYFKSNAEKLHNSVGGALIIAMNENFIVSVTHGRALNSQDGTSGTYIGLNYLF